MSVICEPIESLTLSAPVLRCSHCHQQTSALVVRPGDPTAVCPVCYRAEHWLRHFGRACAADL